MRVRSGDVGIEVAVEGPEDGRPVLLLHGWPDSNRLWRNQLTVSHIESRRSHGTRDPASFEGAKTVPR